MFFHPTRRPKMAQDPSKTGPRLPCAPCFASCFFASILDHFRLRFDAVLGANMSSWKRTEVGGIGPLGGPKRCRGRLGSVLFSSCSFGLIFWSSDRQTDKTDWQTRPDQKDRTSTDQTDNHKLSFLCVSLLFLYIYFSIQLFFDIFCRCSWHFQHFPSLRKS